MNPGQYRAQNEKITDKLRGMFEKFTGKKVCYLRKWGMGARANATYRCLPSSPTRRSLLARVQERDLRRGRNITLL